MNYCSYKYGTPKMMHVMPVTTQAAADFSLYPFDGKFKDIQ
jgi:hypothetical protein